MTTEVCYTVTNYLNMNKILIILLAVYLASTQSFQMHGESSAATGNYWNNLQKNFQHFSKDLNRHMSRTFDHQNVKNKWDKFSEKIHKVMNRMTG